jgi:hypothetical protein
VGEEAVIPLWTVGLAVKGIGLLVKKRRARKQRKELERVEAQVAEFVASIPKGDNVEGLTHFLTLGPLANYRTLIGWLLVVYSICAHVSKQLLATPLPFSDETAMLGFGMIGIGIRFRKKA